MADNAAKPIPESVLAAYNEMARKMNASHGLVERQAAFNVGAIKLIQALIKELGNGTEA